MLRKKIWAAVCLTGFCVNISFALELQPGFNVQGRLTNADGSPRTESSVSMMFSVYKNSADETPVWVKTVDAPLTNGDFQVLLEGVGDGAWPSIENAVRDFPGAYVEIKVGEEAPMTPRLPLVKSAFTSTDRVFSNIDVLIHSETGNISLKTGDTEKVVVLNNGNVGIGTSSPDAKLTIAGGVKIVNGSEGDGKILTSDAVGNATWKPVPASGGSGGGSAGPNVVSDIHEDDNDGSGTDFCTNSEVVVAEIDAVKLTEGRPFVINAYASVELSGYDFGASGQTTAAASPWVTMYIKKDELIALSPQYNWSGAYTSHQSGQTTGGVTVDYGFTPSIVYSGVATDGDPHKYTLVLHTQGLCGTSSNRRFNGSAFYYARGMVITGY